MSAVALDPLIAEAKRRMRRRRLLALAAAGLVAVSAVTATLTTRSSKQPRLALASATCRNGQLRVSLANAGAATGSATQTFTFENSSSSTCVLIGWPSLRLVLPDGRTVTPRLHRLIALGYSVAHPPPLPRVRLAPGATAHGFLQEADGTGLNRLCPSSEAVLVTPPGTREPVKVIAHVPYCGARYFWALPVGRAS